MPQPTDDELWEQGRRYASIILDHDITHEEMSDAGWNLACVFDRLRWRKEHQ